MGGLPGSRMAEWLDCWILGWLNGSTAGQQDGWLVGSLGSRDSIMVRFFDSKMAEYLDCWITGKLKDWVAWLTGWMAGR